MSDDALCVLITGAGAPGTKGTLHALRRNPEGRPVRVVGVDARADVVGRFLVDRFHQVPPPEDAAYVTELAALCGDERVDVILPQTTREIARLSECAATFESQGHRVLASDASAIRAANSKLRVCEVFEELGLPTPTYRLTRSEQELRDAAESQGYPGRAVVVKPPVSNGMRGVRVLRENAWDVGRFLSEKPSGLEVPLDELIAILQRGGDWPELLVMEYLPGPEYSVDAFLGSAARIALPRRRDAIRSGISFNTTVELRADLMEYTLRAAEHIGLRYCFGFQYKLDEHGVPRVLECNPRVQGTMIASVFAGVNVIWLAVKERIGEPPTALPEPRLARLYRYWGGVGVWDDGTEEI